MAGDNCDATATTKWRYAGNNDKDDDNGDDDDDADDDDDLDQHMHAMDVCKSEGENIVQGHDNDEAQTPGHPNAWKPGARGFPAKRKWLKCQNSQPLRRPNAWTCRWPFRRSSL